MFGIQMPNKTAMIAFLRYRRQLIIMSHDAHAYLLNPMYEIVEDAVVGRIMKSRELEIAIDDILEDDGLWDDHYGKYEDEWIRFEEEFRAENPDEEWPDWTEEYLNILGAIFENNNGHVYLYPYEIAYKYAGEDWMKTLLEIDGIEDMSDKEIVDEFLKLGTDLEKACRDYLAEEVMNTHTGYW